MLFLIYIIIINWIQIYIKFEFPQNLKDYEENRDICKFQTSFIGSFPFFVGHDERIFGIDSLPFRHFPAPNIITSLPSLEDNLYN